MSRPRIALIADPTSPEGCRDYLAEAVELLTGTPPVRVDSRHFATGGAGRAVRDGGRLRLRVPEEGLDLVPDVVVLYEIPPHRRAELASFQRLLEECDVVTLGTGPDAWRTATEKNLTVERFRRDGVAQMDTVVLSRPTRDEARDAYEELGGDTWARPVVGTGGNDTFHVNSLERLAEAAAYYAGQDTDWLLSRDAGNVTADGLRHQFRVFVLGSRIVHAREHLQPEDDTPCNTCRGATPVHLGAHGLPPRLAELAIAATASVGLPFAGVDLAVENGGVVFEVNVQPAFVDGELPLVAVPYIEAHLEAHALATGAHHSATRVPLGRGDRLPSR
ncbi:ATP-grasp domain-containing protein [Streptomyces acidiscabies]|uniref:ATP-grasp domain-containing protein n=1 Tax=Streptomyces acidiscabies TaxID=42234 RepID=UPI00073F2051|nr:alpha-L-glutamate ligase [Streptomyces acidiscabies]GAQ51971.1 ribosomal protein S6--L-glutamate ligase [Streptomyces acidiscabies]